MKLSKLGLTVLAVAVASCGGDSGDAKPVADAGGSADSGRSPSADASSTDGSVTKDAAIDAGSFLWYATCGDPVCRIDAPSDSGVPACDAGQRRSESCQVPGVECDPGEGCGVLLRCTDSDPTMRLGGCPISRADFKTDIQYLDARELQRYHDQMMGLGLAHYRYRDDPSAQERLGFIIEDVEPSRFVDEARDRVDMYAYTSALVAALQVQEQRIRQLERTVEKLHHSGPAAQRARRSRITR